MAYDQKLVERLRAILANRKDVVEKKMFGGIAFMINGSMACGPQEDSLIVRIGEEAATKAMKEKHVKPMDFTGKVLKNFATIQAAGLKTEKQLRKWVELSARHAESLAEKRPQKRQNEPLGRPDPIVFNFIAFKSLSLDSPARSPHLLHANPD